MFVADTEWVENLKKANYHVTRIKDITDPSQHEVKRSHIIFVDYRGVGKNLASKDEGLGLIRILKETYGKKKRIILYTAAPYKPEEVSDAMKYADAILPKNSDQYLFIKMIESELKKLK